MQVSPIAVILCKFSDTDNEPVDRQRIEEIFTLRGRGKWNVLDYFDLMSHGRLDLSGSEVFGWFRIGFSQSFLQGDSDSKLSRSRSKTLKAAARFAALHGGVDQNGNPTGLKVPDLSKFHSIAVVLNANPQGVRANGSTEGSLLPLGNAGDDIIEICPAVVCHEYGHIFGLHHAQIPGGSEYSDSYDVMGNRDSWINHPIYQEKTRSGRPSYKIPAGLNAANMESRGWLDESRVREIEFGAIPEVLELRPLHRRDLPGILAVRFVGHLVEFRVATAWDGGIRTGIYVRTFEGGHSYLQAGKGVEGSLSPQDSGVILGPGTPDLPDPDIFDPADDTPHLPIVDLGDVFAPGPPKIYALGEGGSFQSDPDFSIYGSGYSIRVLSIDEDELVAKVAFSSTKPMIPVSVEDRVPRREPWLVWGDELRPNEGVLNVGGQMLHLANNGPAAPLLQGVAEIEASRAIAAPALQALVQREAYRAIAGLALARITDLDRRIADIKQMGDG